MTVVDRSDQHLYQPGFLFLPFGIYDESHIIRRNPDFMPRGVEFARQRSRSNPPSITR
jgi:sulfide:quinone oxidoreductase